MDFFITFVKDLRPIDLSVVMLTFTIVDLWTGLKLALQKNAVLSKRLIRGVLFNITVVITPFLLDLLSHFQQFGYVDPTNFGYIKILSLAVTALYTLSTTTSILANYSATNPEAYNILTRFTNKYLSAELNEKLNKHDSTDEKASNQ